MPKLNYFGEKDKVDRLNEADSLKKDERLIENGLPILTALLNDHSDAQSVERFFQKSLPDLLRKTKVNGRVYFDLLKVLLESYPNLSKSLSEDFLRKLDHALDDPVRTHRDLRDLLTGHTWSGLSEDDISQTIYTVEDLRDLFLEAHLQTIKTQRQ